MIVPAAPRGEYFVEGARVFPQFIEHILKECQGPQIPHRRHVEWRIERVLYHGVLPQYFWSGTGFPGYLPHPTSARVTALATMCINMHVGELDAGWLENMLDQAQEFRAKGYTVAFTVEKGQSHVIGTLAGTAPRGCSMRSRKPSRAADSN